jgi:RNAse (barnase) inhibitor barstar
MAWQVGVVFDQGESVEKLHVNLSILLGQMPVWVIAAPNRIPAIDQLRKDWEQLWLPEPALTLADPVGDTEKAALGLVPILLDHHWKMFALRLFGLDITGNLIRGFEDSGFFRVSGSMWDGTCFAQKLNQNLNEVEIPLLELNAQKWRSASDFYDTFFKTVGAPLWHGKNLNALSDSIGTGRINAIEVPYKIQIKNWNSTQSNSELSKVIQGFSELIASLQSNGCPVELNFEPSCMM